MRTTTYPHKPCVNRSLDNVNPGDRISPKVIFGICSRYAVYAVRTRWNTITWFVDDAEQYDGLGLPEVIRQAESFEEAVDGLWNQDYEWEN